MKKKLHLNLEWKKMILSAKSIGSRLHLDNYIFLFPDKSYQKIHQFFVKK